MFVKVWSAAAVVALGLSSTALAQSVADIGGPREMPPAGYTQQQYVDSRGCVFLRAGLGGQVRWVPRIGDNRRPICNATPTFGRAARDAVAALDAAEEGMTAPAPAEAPRVAANTARATPVAPAAPRPAATARVPAESYVPAPVANVAPAPVLRPRPASIAPAPVTRLAATGSTGRRIACTTAAPVAERVALTNGGSVIVCTRGDGTLDGWRAPIYPDGAPVGASILPPEHRAAGTRMAGYAPLGQPQHAPQAGTARAPAVAATIPVPEGYKLSWDDDRLNPLRGVRTLQGEAQQDRVWTRTVPATAVADAPRPRADRQAVVTVSTKGQPQAELPAPSARPLYIQVGAFGDPANAQGSTARLQAAGLPVAISRSRGLQVVMAGPFGSQAEAAQALSIARGAGFGDASVR
jgi:hypothetical protein